MLSFILALIRQIAFCSSECEVHVKRQIGGQRTFAVIIGLHVYLLHRDGGGDARNFHGFHEHPALLVSTSI